MSFLLRKNGKWPLQPSLTHSITGKVFMKQNDKSGNRHKDEKFVIGGKFKLSKNIHTLKETLQHISDISLACPATKLKFSSIINKVSHKTSTNITQKQQSARNVSKFAEPCYHIII